MPVCSSNRATSPRYTYGGQIATSALTPAATPWHTLASSGRMEDSVPFIFQFAATSGRRLLIRSSRVIEGRSDYRLGGLKSIHLSLVLCHLSVVRFQPLAPSPLSLVPCPLSVVRSQSLAPRGFSTL